MLEQADESRPLTVIGQVDRGVPGAEAVETARGSVGSHLGSTTAGPSLPKYKDKRW
jgi:hypothetical protein